MKRLFFIAVLSFAIFLPTTVFAQEQEILPAPFGLKWGMNKQEIEKLNVVLEKRGKHGTISAYRTDSLPKNLSDHDYYFLFLDDRYGLSKVTYISKDITGDIYGAEGKEKYSRLKKKLTGKYGIPKTYEFIGNELYDESDEFYQCLKYDGCGAYTSHFELKNNNAIALELLGVKRGEGVIRLIYESDLFIKVKTEEEANIDVSDEDAL